MKRSVLKGALWLIIGIAIVTAGFFVFEQLDSKITDVNVVISPNTIPADGVSTTVLRVQLISRFGNDLNVSVLPEAPVVRIIEGGDLIEMKPVGDDLRYVIRAGNQTGRVVFHVKIFGIPAPIEATLDLTASLA